MTPAPSSVRGVMPGRVPPGVHLQRSLSSATPRNCIRPNQWTHGPSATFRWRCREHRHLDGARIGDITTAGRPTPLGARDASTSTERLRLTGGEQHLVHGAYVATRTILGYPHNDSDYSLGRWRCRSAPIRTGNRPGSRADLDAAPRHRPAGHGWRRSPPDPQELAPSRKRQEPGMCRHAGLLCCTGE